MVAKSPPERILDCQGQLQHHLPCSITVAWENKLIMAITRKDLDALREGWDFEAKSAQGRDGMGEVPRSLWETYSAMANTRGGRIVLGVKELDSGAFDIRGLGDPEKVQRDLWSTLGNRSKVSIDLLQEDDVALEEIEGRTILVINLPRAPRDCRPVFINDDVWGGTYLRIHEGDHHASRDRVRRMIAEADSETRDDRVLSGFGQGDLHPESLRAYRTVFRSARPDHPWLPLDDQEFLTQLGAWRRDRERGEEGLTVAGLLMFGNHRPIMEAFPTYMVDYQERRPGAEVIEWKDRVHPDGSWSGNLYDFYRRVAPKLVSELKVPFQLDSDMFRKDETHVHEALREGLINCLIHADYEGRVSLLVIKRNDGFEFRNPGLLRLPVEKIRQGGVSDCRNRTLQGMFTHLGLGEQAGSGYSRILRAWKEQHWRVPSLLEDVETEHVTLHLSMVSLLPKEVLDELERRFPKRYRSLPEEARLALATAMSEGQVTNRRMQEISDRHPRDLTFMFRDLVRDGFLEQQGERSGTWYIVPLPPGDPDRRAQSSGRSPQSSPQSPPQSSPQSSFPEVEDKGDPVTQVAQTRWAEQRKIRKAILSFCQEDFRSISELSESLNRSQRTIRENYLRAMVAGELVELRYPDKPSHPAQAYRTVREGERDT